MTLCSVPVVFYSSAFHSGEELDSEEDQIWKKKALMKILKCMQWTKICGCEESLYASVLALRERCLDVYEALVENVKLLEITLYMHQLTGMPQVEYIENAAIPKDLSGGLIFTNALLKQLRAMI
ncbi:hypothetical protein SELMODRAFT_430652 [Selaginella moellendorffii]|uniref:Uncharacterized protein n=1 Tax=Selaginella moellendorffii TaxID=88036 RepID=D8TA27_SELML|nr:hypothetical protein SELMODRAFT_430652 [Selaginella moellendorffii]